MIVALSDLMVHPCTQVTIVIFKSIYLACLLPFFFVRNYLGFMFNKFAPAYYKTDVDSNICAIFMRPVSGNQLSETVNQKITRIAI